MKFSIYNIYTHMYIAFVVAPTNTPTSWTRLYSIPKVQPIDPKMDAYAYRTGSVPYIYISLRRIDTVDADADADATCR